MANAGEDEHKWGGDELAENDAAHNNEPGAAQDVSDEQAKRIEELMVSNTTHDTHTPRWVGFWCRSGSMQKHRPATACSAADVHALCSCMQIWRLHGLCRSPDNL